MSLAATLETLKSHGLLERVTAVSIDGESVDVRLGPTSQPADEDPRKRAAAEEAEREALLYASS